MFSKIKSCTLFSNRLLATSVFVMVGLFVCAPVSIEAVTYKCDTPEEKKACSKLLDQTENEIKELNSQLTAAKQTESSLARDKQILALKIKQAQLEIKARELSIANIGKDIIQKTKTIEKLESKIDTGRQTLAQIMRKTNQLDGYSMPEIILGNDTLSNVFADLDAFDSVKSSLSSVFTELRDSKKANEEAKISLDEKRIKEIDTKVSIEADKRKVQIAEAEKQRLINISKNEQAGYQSIIADKAAEIAKIKSAMFGLRDSAAIPFEEAYKYAKNSAAKTGVRSALILAILTQESNLGANVGSCYLKDKETGAGVKISSGAYQDRVMKPTRDVAPFLQITEEVGRDWTKTRVSCPFTVGYGGAMGPSQFIPSTWNIFKSRISKALGGVSPDPWNPEHAIMATAMYISDLGAGSKTYTAERNAACKYYSGKACNGTLNNFYGDQVVAKANKLQTNIDLIEGN
jgi:membrane-bound lytic murein transglycosylase B